MKCRVWDYLKQRIGGECFTLDRRIRGGKIEGMIGEGGSNEKMYLV